MMKDTNAVPRCRDCRHYYITFDRNFPYGCRELGFKSAREPMRDVIESSGEVCLYFSPGKPKRPR
ncbi:MAG: hypothetical protein KGZ68_06300 [Dechloromonas sp.]|jgi:hypothetical protein|nr:hypothetical protein [Dechloromonas sp.]